MPGVLVARLALAAITPEHRDMLSPIAAPERPAALVYLRRNNVLARRLLAEQLAALPVGLSPARAHHLDPRCRSPGTVDAASVLADDTLKPLRLASAKRRSPASKVSE